MKPKISLFWSQIDVEKPNCVYIQARYEGPVVAQLRLDVNDGAGWIGALYIQEACRGKGLGSLLVQRACSICKNLKFESVGLTVHEDNEKARKLYRHLGFVAFTSGYDKYQQFIKLL